MKKKLFLVLAVVLVIGTGAFACQHPWQNAELRVRNPLFGDDKAMASMDRCTCIPVDNELCVWLRVQYFNGTNFVFDPDEPMYYYSVGYDVPGVSITIEQPEIHYAEAKFVGTCGDDDEVIEWFERNIDIEGYGRTTTPRVNNNQ